ncbi:hypothetical protein ACA910_017041 [Epithemia clementina (nom. ined.)]
MAVVPSSDKNHTSDTSSSSNSSRMLQDPSSSSLCPPSWTLTTQEHEERIDCVSTTNWTTSTSPPPASAAPTTTATTMMMSLSSSRDVSPERPRQSPYRVVSPSNSYSDTTAAMMEPISPKQGSRRSVHMDEGTYNMLTGKTTMPLHHHHTTTTTTTAGGVSKTGTSPTRIGSCPYCRLGSVEHNCAAKQQGIVLYSTLQQPQPTFSRLECFPASPSAEDLSSCTTDKEGCGEQKREELAPIIPTVTAGGVTYHPEEVLAEGWLQKKGTGQDWLGSRGWKARWARLCMASTSVDMEPQSHHHNNSGGSSSTQTLRPTSPEPFGQPHPPPHASSPIVPILLLYWFPSSTTVSTAIVLDSTVVMAVDLADKNHVNPYRFEVRHATTQENVTLPTTTRTFAAPPRERDAWVYAISQALLTYAKAKERARKLQEYMVKTTITSSSSPRISPRGVVVGLEEEYPWIRQSPWSDRGGVSISKEKSSSAPPPLSPTILSARRLSIPKRCPPARSSSTSSLL